MLPTGNMRDSMSMKLLVYETDSGRRLRAVEEHGHLGDCSSLRGGLFEMRLAGRVGLRI